jgi:predicted acetyltransferase
MSIQSLQIVKASIDDEDVLYNLLQFYFYDFSEFVGSDVEEDGLFAEYPYLESYWAEEDSRFPYLIKVNGKNAGFVLVRLIKSAEKAAYYSIAEFFIMKKYRRSGLGKQVAKQIFDKHRGNWEVFQIEKNIPAQQFWRQVINEYTGGNYSERVEEGNRLQDFVSCQDAI